MNKGNIASVLLSLFPLYCAYLSLHNLQFLVVEAQKYVMPLGAKYPSYATVLKNVMIST